MEYYNIYIYIYILDAHMAPYGAFLEHSVEEHSSVDEKVIAKCDFEHAAQVFCRRRADSTVF